MTEQFKIGEQSFDVVVRAYGEANKGFQAVAAEVTDYSKNALEDATHAFQQLVSAGRTDVGDPVSVRQDGLRRLHCRVEAR